MSKKVQEMLGTFAAAGEFAIHTLDGKPTNEIVAAETVVTGNWKAVVKDQIARVIGVCTQSMCNARDKEDRPIYRFQGNGWEPEASIGDLILQDVDNEIDIWAVKPNLFGSTGWNGSVAKNGLITFAKPGKPLLALQIPDGTPVESLEGPQVTEKGGLLRLTDANKGDFFCWQANVVKKYVHDYKG